MRSIVKFATKLSLTALIVCTGFSGVYANTLSEVEINSMDSGYGIVLKTEEAAQMKKTISSPDKMSVELKDVTASENLNTVYNNVANIDNVTISPASKNDIKITFKGKDIANSKISFETLKTDIPAVPAPANQSIKLNAPVSSYSPVYNPDNFVEEDESQTSNPKLNEVLTQMHITKEMLLSVKRYIKSAANHLNNALHGDINLATVVGIILIIGAFMFKSNKKQGSVKPERTIGLTSRANLDREIDINRNLAGNMNLSKASQTRLPATKAGYGMKAYQQSQKNPYMTANTVTNGISGIARRKPLSSSSSPIKKQTLSAQPVNNMSAPLKQNVLNNKVNSPMSPVLPKLNQHQKPAINMSIGGNQATSGNHRQALSQQSDLDSMKFLESITKIYENSGRSDLAKGLKDNLRKAQMSRV